MLKIYVFLIATILSLPSALRAATPLFVDATAADNFKSYWLIKAQDAPVIDGKLDDDIWKKAKPLQDWGICDYGRQKGALGEIDFRAAWDDTYLYIGARMYHRRKPADMDEFNRMVTDTSKPIHARECMEIHIDGNLDHATRFQSMVNAMSEKWMCWYYDFGWGILENTDYGLDADWDVAGSVGDDHWSVEVRYALSDIQVKPVVGTMFGINPCWFNWADSRESDAGYWWHYTTWSTHGASHHDPRLFGRFILVDDEPASLETGLRLAFPDLEKRSLMIQTADGLLAFKNGKQSLQPYASQVRREAADTRVVLSQVNDLLASGKASAATAHISKNTVPENDESLKKVEARLAADDPLSRGAIAGLRAELGTIRSNLEDIRWRVQEDILLTAVTPPNAPPGD